MSVRDKSSFGLICNSAIPWFGIWIEQTMHLTDTHPSKKRKKAKSEIAEWIKYTISIVLASEYNEWMYVSVFCFSIFSFFFGYWLVGWFGRCLLSTNTEQTVRRTDRQKAWKKFSLYKLHINRCACFQIGCKCTYKIGCIVKSKRKKMHVKKIREEKELLLFSYFFSLDHRPWNVRAYGYQFEKKCSSFQWRCTLI